MFTTNSGVVRVLKIFSLIFLVFVGMACKEKYSGLGTTPQDRIKEYVELSFSVRTAEDRQKLESFLVDEAKKRLEGWSKPQFEKAFIQNHRKFLKLAFLEEKSVSTSETQITYEMTFTEGEDPKHSSRTTLRKACQMVLQGDRWFIRDCRNIKQLVEYQDELSLP